MKYIEKQGDLFSLKYDYFLVHCISADYALGKGIAKTFDSKYNMREKLFATYPIDKNQEDQYVGKALLIENVFNLVTKKRYFQKPTYDVLQGALDNLAEQCAEKEINRLAMPMIGCGLDKLNWVNVRSMIIETFRNTEIEIVICKL